MKSTSRLFQAWYWESVYAIANRKIWLVLSVSFLGSILAYSSTVSLFNARVKDIENILAISRGTEAPFGDLVAKNDANAVAFVREVEAVRRGTTPVGLVHGALDLASFILAPTLGLFLGEAAIAKWRSYGLLKQRATEVGWPAAVAGGQLAGLLLGAIFAVTLCMASVVVSVFGRYLVELSPIPAEVRPNEISLDPLSALAPKILFCWIAFALFYLLGYALAMVIDSRLPVLVLVIALWAVPITSAGDPRSVLAEMGRKVFDFQGGFTLGTDATSSSIGTAVALCVVASALTVPFAVVGRRSRYR